MDRIKAIREAVEQRLLDAAIPRIGTNIFPDRSFKLWPDELPAICVYTRRTDFEGKDRQPRDYQAETRLVVETIVKGDYDPGGGAPIESVPNQLNDFSQLIVDTLIYPWDAENRDHTKPPLGPLDGAAADIILESITSDSGMDGEKVVGGEAVTFAIDWNQILPPEEPPDTFKRMGMSILTPAEANAEDLDIDDVIVVEPEE